MKTVGKSALSTIRSLIDEGKLSDQVKSSTGSVYGFYVEGDSIKIINKFSSKEYIIFVTRFDALNCDLSIDVAENRVNLIIDNLSIQLII